MKSRPISALVGCVLLALLPSLMCVGVASGQFGGGRPRETVWKCGRCGKELARGEQEPFHIRSCPLCGAKFKDGPKADMVRFQPAVDFWSQYATVFQWTCGICGAFVAFIAIGVVAGIVKRMVVGKTPPTEKGDRAPSIESDTKYPRRGPGRF